MMYAIFRAADGGPGWLDGVHYQAELHDPDANEVGGLSYPVAVAWITLFPPEIMPPLLDFIMVPDHLRRCGYATHLVRFCKEHWPGLLLTDAISESGAGLMASLDM